MGDTNIGWTDKTWNPVVGCEKVSAGCKNCYAKQLHDQRHKAHRAGKRVPSQYAKPFEEVQLMPDRLRDPLSWRKPCRVFVNSVSDLFHGGVPFEYIANVFGIMQLATRHTFQVLTKRPERMRRFFETHRHWSGQCDGIAQTVDEAALTWAGSEAPNQPGWPLPNVWLGVSVENQVAADERIPHLLATPAAVRFLSCEPLLEPVSLHKHLPKLRCESCYYDGNPHEPEANSSFVGGKCPRCGNAASRFVSPAVNWVIVGGESGPGARDMRTEWAGLLVEQCKAASVPVFVKQDSGVKPGQQGRIPLEVWQHKEFPNGNL